MTDTQIREMVERAFAGSPRPEHFTNYTHCSECEEHDAMLRSRTVETLQIGDIDNPCWDAVCFLTPQGWLYYFAAFVRLCFADLDNSYISQFLFHLSYEDNWERFSLFNHEQKQAVILLLHHIGEHHLDSVQDNADQDLLQQAIKMWETQG